MQGPLKTDNAKILRATYDDTSLKRYVYPTNRAIALAIIYNWANARKNEINEVPFDGNSRYAILYAPMQSGKTGVIAHIYYLLNVDKNCGKYQELLGKFRCIVLCDNQNIFHQFPLQLF